MKEKKLAKFIEENFVEIHIYDPNGEEYLNLDMLSPDVSCSELDDWKVYASVYCYDLNALSDILGHDYFNDGIQIIWKDGYVVIDLMDIVNYFNLDIKKVI